MARYLCGVGETGLSQRILFFIIIIVIFLAVNTKF